MLTLLLTHRFFYPTQHKRCNSRCYYCERRTINYCYNGGDDDVFAKCHQANCSGYRYSGYELSCSQRRLATMLKAEYPDPPKFSLPPKIRGKNAVAVIAAGAL